MQETKELKGLEMAAAIEVEVRRGAVSLLEKGIQPKMVGVLTSDDPSMLAYVRSKVRMAERLGMVFEPVNITGSQSDLEKELQKLSANPAVHGIVLELPLEKKYDFISALSFIDPKKDVDGLTPENLGLAMRGEEEKNLCAATAMACVLLMESITDLNGKKITLVGKGKTVGRPLLPLLLNRQATVTVAHSHTKDLKAAIAGADIVISATGVPGLLNKDMIQKGQMVIDAGLSFVGNEIKGDADKASLMGIASVLTPVPEGVGPVTSALVFRNLLKAVNMQIP